MKNDKRRNHALLFYGGNHDRILELVADHIYRAGGNIEQIVGQGYGTISAGAGLIPHGQTKEFRA